MKGLNEPVVDTVRSRQIAAIKQAINFNTPVPDTLAYEPQWKVLILDKYSQDVIAPLLNVKQLRDLGVTLHLLVTSKRESLPDVPAVYFVSPTDENIHLICDDLQKAMYDKFFLNMIYPLSRPRLEMLAQSAVNGSSVQQVQKLMDQYLNFISLEDDLFVLRRYNEESSLSYHAINDPDTTDEQMVGLIDSIVDGLFSVCATMGVVPIIRCQKDNAAEEVATKLDQKIRDNFRDARNNLFTMENIRAGQMNVHRPVLIIADRGMDLATMLHHTWTYQALIHDVLDLDLNRVSMFDKQGKRKEYEMNATDKLWQRSKGKAFPEVAESVQSDVEEYRKHESEIKDLKSAMGMEGDQADEAMSMLSDTTAKLSSKVGSLPELLEKKRLLDMHTNVATAVLDHIKQRKLDVLFETEEKILNRQQQDVALIEQMKICTEPLDALRLMLINFLCTPNISKSELEEQCAYLRELGVDESAVKFVQRLRSVSHMHRANEEQIGAGTKTVSMFSKLLDHSSRFVMEGVKNLVLKKHSLPLTKMVDSLIDTRSGGQNSNTTEEFRYFDPKLMHTSRDVMKARGGHLAQDVIVFVVGGGNYVEYQNIAEYGKSKGLTRITYGTTEIANPRQFTDQLTRLGRKVK